MITAAELGVPETFNAASWFVDRNVADANKLPVDYGAWISADTNSSNAIPIPYRHE